jgi:ABC-type lipoprotein release transport system permease subunit
VSLLHRQRNILEYTLRGMLRRTGRNASLLVVYTFVVGLVASVMFFTGAIREEAAAVLAGSPEMIVQHTVAGRHDLMPEADLRALGRIRGVREVRGRLWGYYFDPAVGANYTVMADPAFAHGPGEMLIGPGIATDRVAGVGDVFPFAAHSGSALNMRIVGVLPAESELVAADMILMGEADYRTLSGVPEGFVTDAVLSVRNPRELVTIARKVTEELPGSRPIIRDEVLRTYEAVFNWRGGMVLAVLGGAVLAFIIFAWDRASGLSAEERREIGILKAVGWETTDVLALKFWEGAAISLSAYLLGVILAYAHVFLFDSALFEPALKGWSVLYPAFKLVPRISALELAALFFLTVAPYTVSTIVPAWRASVDDPDAVMRQ